MDVREYIFFTIVIDGNINNTIFPGEAEAGLERLHKCAEKDLQIYLEGDAPNPSFNDFRTKLAGLTRCLSRLILLLLFSYSLSLYDICY